MAKSKQQARVYQLKVTLRDIRPPVWRRVQVADCSLAELHDVIQAVMGWTNSHLHLFEVGGEQYGESDPEGESDFEDEARMTLGRVVAGGHKKLAYTYDFGDSWEHAVLVEKVLDADPGVRYPRCLAGKRACPPEDCGGASGYADFLDAVQDPAHEEHAEMVEWAGGSFDAERFDAEKVNEELWADR